MMNEEDLYHTAMNCIEVLTRANINFVAIDFDLTLVDIHTGGRWNNPVKDLVKHVRPLFVVLIKLLLENNIFVAVVSFSPQTAIIRDTLRSSLPDYVDQIIIQARDKAFETEAGSESKDGKLNFMASAVHEIARCYSNPPEQTIEITRASSLLIDDTKKNVEIALNHYVRALVFDPCEPESILQDLLELY